MKKWMIAGCCLMAGVFGPARGLGDDVSPAPAAPISEAPAAVDTAAPAPEPALESTPDVAAEPMPEPAPEVTPEPTLEAAAPVPDAGADARPRPDTAQFAFPVGERLVYSVHWGFLHVGETHVWSEWVEEDGRDLLAIRVTTRTVSFMDKIYPVDDFLESIVDPATFLPLRFTKRLSEGRYRLHEVTTFDHVARRAHWKHLLRENSEHDFDIDPDTRDLLSFMFFMRSQTWQLKKEYKFRVMADEKLYDLIVHTRKYENFELEHYGKVRSLLVEPEAKFQGLFVRLGRLFVWISDDARCVCTKATAKVPVGTVRVVLLRVEGPGNDHWVNAGRNAAKPDGDQ